MNLDGVAGVVGFDPNRPSRPVDLIAVLPDEVRGGVDAALVTVLRLEDFRVEEPLAGLDVTRVIAGKLEQSAADGQQVDVLADAARLIADSDASTVVFHARRLALESAESKLRDACVAAIPAAFVSWTRRVKELAGIAEKLIAAGAVVDELEARRGSKSDLQRWETLMNALNEYDVIRSAFLDARFLLDRGDVHDRFSLSAAFKGTYDSAHGQEFRRVVEQCGHPLVAAVRLGWVPWCPSRADQLADEGESMRLRREGGLRVPRDVIVA